jgi:hypothetical protein
VEAKLFLYQFQKVYNKNQQQQQHYLRWLASSQKKSQMVGGANIPPSSHKKNDVSGITNFSLELEMLNKMQVQKNSNESLS